MAISSVLFVPDKGKDKMLNNLLPVLNNIENGKSDKDINKIVLTSDIDTLKSFYFLNYFMDLNFITNDYDSTRTQWKIARFTNKLFVSMVKLLNIDASIDTVSYSGVPIITDDIISKFNVSADTDFYYLHIFKTLVENNVDINSIFKEIYTIPKNNNTLLIVVVDQDKYLSIITSLIGVFKNIIGDKLIANYYLLEFTHGILSMYFKDILKQEIVKQPDVGVVVIDNTYANLNKSYLYSII